MPTATTSEEQREEFFNVILRRLPYDVDTPDDPYRRLRIQAAVNSKNWCVPAFHRAKEFVFEDCWAFFPQKVSVTVPVRASVQGDKGKTCMLRRLIAAYLCARSQAPYPARRVLVPDCISNVAAFEYWEQIKDVDETTLLLIDDNQRRKEINWSFTAFIVAVNAKLRDAPVVDVTITAERT